MKISRILSSYSINKINNPAKAVCLITLILFGFLFSPNATYAGDSIAWVARFADPDGYDDMLLGFFTDSISGNIYMACGSKQEDTLSKVCDVCVDNSVIFCIYLIKYDSLGQQRWVRRYDGNGDLRYNPICMKMDEGKNICIAGITRYPKGNDTGAFLLVKYDTTGEKILEKTYGNTDNFPDYLLGLYFDDNFNLFQFGANNISTDSLEIIALKYDTAGKIVWKRKYKPKGYEKIWSFDFHILENEGLYLLMTAEHPLRWDDWVIVKVSPKGDIQWEKIYKNTGNASENLSCSMIDNRENLYLTGKVIDESGNSDFCTMKIDSFGNIKWISQYNGPENLRDEAHELDFDKEGNIFVAGMSVIKEVGEYWAIRVIKYDSLGHQKWVSTKSRLRGNYELGMMTVKDENIFVIGTAITATIDTHNYAIVIKYDTSGNEIWVKNYFETGASAQSKGEGVEFDNRGNMYIYGICETNEKVFLIKYWGR